MGTALDKSAKRETEYWDWITVVLFLFLTADTITTMYASRKFGLEAEANPVMQWVLSQGIFMLVVYNIVAMLLVVVIFYGLVELMNQVSSPYDRYMSLVVEVWIGLVITAGLVVFANNVAVIVLGESLL